MDDVLDITTTAAIESVAEATSGWGGPFAETIFGAALLVVIIVFHGLCLNQVSKHVARRFARFTPQTRPWRANLLMTTTIAALVAIHFVETLIWAAPIAGLAIIPGFDDAYYYVLEAYTTLGEGTVKLPDHWRLAGPVIAISGLFTFGWTASVLVYLMNEIGRFHSRSAADNPTDSGS